MKIGRNPHALRKQRDPRRRGASGDSGGSITKGGKWGGGLTGAAAKGTGTPFGIPAILPVSAQTGALRSDRTCHRFFFASSDRVRISPRTQDSRRANVLPITAGIIFHFIFPSANCLFLSTAAAAQCVPRALASSRRKSRIKDTSRRGKPSNRENSH